MDYESEAYKVLNELKEKYTIADLIPISQRLLCMVLAKVIYENKWNSFQQNLIFLRLEQTLPHGVEGLLKIMNEMNGGRDANP